MKLVHQCALVLGTLGLILTLMPYYKHVTIHGLPDGVTKTIRRYTLGFPDSPFLLVENSETPAVQFIRPDGGLTAKGAGMSRKVELGLLSWSMLALVIGGLILEADKRWIKPRVEPTLIGPGGSSRS